MWCISMETNGKRSTVRAIADAVALALRRDCSSWIRLSDIVAVPSTGVAMFDLHIDDGSVYSVVIGDVTSFK